MTQQDLERAVCAVICQADGIRAREIAEKLGFERKTVNQILYSSPLMKELCWQDRDYRWHGLVMQARPHVGLQELNIGRNLNDTRGLIHSFRDCRETVLHLFDDLLALLGESCLDWEIAFELRLKRSRYVRIYADVLIITEDRVFSLEFKMKDTIDPDEVLQAAKYAPFLEIVFGPKYEIIPVLVLTKAAESFDFVPIGRSDMVLPVCSGDMLFSVFDEYIGFLN